MTPDELSRWIAQSGRGASCVIGRGARLPDELGVVVNRMASDGLIAPCRKRMGGEFTFMVQRSGVSIDRVKPAVIRGRGRVRRALVPSSAETAILRMLRECLKTGRPFSTNEEIARRAKLASRVSASDRLKRLARRGVIKIEDFGPFEHRVVTLCATGEKTVRGAR